VRYLPYRNDVASVDARQQHTASKRRPVLSMSKLQLREGEQAEPGDYRAGWESGTAPHNSMTFDCRRRSHERKWGTAMKGKYLQYADDCMKAADEVGDPALRESLLEISAAWLKLAEEAITRAGGQTADRLSDSSINDR
jgi:hypothetical protein